MITQTYKHEKRDQPEENTLLWYRAYKIEYSEPLWTVFNRRGKFLFSGNHLEGCKRWIDAFMYGEVR